MSTPAVQVRNVTYAYPDGQTALRNVSFEVEQGECVAVIGGNGAGKSTLLLHLNGFLMAQCGSVHVGELLVTRESLVAVRRNVGMVFQNPDDQLFMATVYDDVAFGPTNMKLSVAEIEQRVRASLDTVGCTHLAARPPHRLSGGEKRSVAIAGILAMEPCVLVLDEPSDGLDPAARRNLIHLLRDFTHTRLIATHDLDLVLDVCSRVLVLRQGEVQADGPPESVFSNIELLQSCRLEQPLGWQSRRL